MKTINLRAFDLNLLPILHALIEERSVTKASLRVNLSQSAASSALRRLRETLEDPILTRKGRRMVASPKALQIQEELGEALGGISNVLSTMRIDSLTDERIEYAICGPDYVMMTLSDAILQVLLGMPHANARIEPFNRKMIFDQLERGQVDVAMGAFGRLKPAFRRATLFEEHIVVIMCKDHPVAARQRDGAMSLAEFCYYPHLQVTGGDSLEDTWAARLLSSLGIERQVTATLPTLALVPDLLRQTELLCIGTLRALGGLPEAATRLTHLELPLELGPRDYKIEMIWHERSESDCQALRDTILAASAMRRAEVS